MEIKQVSFRMSDEDHAALKSKAAAEKTTIQELLSEFVQNYLKKPKEPNRIIDMDSDKLHELVVQAKEVADDLAAIELMKIMQDQHLDKKR